MVIHMGAIRIFQAMFGEVLPKSGKALDFKSQVRQIGLNVHGAAAGKPAYFDLFLAFRRFEKYELAAPGRFVPLHLLEAEDILVEIHGGIDVVHTISGM